MSSKTTAHISNITIQVIIDKLQYGCGCCDHLTCMLKIDSGFSQSLTLDFTVSLED